MERSDDLGLSQKFDENIRVHIISISQLRDKGAKTPTFPGSQYGIGEVRELIVRKDRDPSDGAKRALDGFLFQPIQLRQPVRVSSESQFHGIDF